MSGSFSEAYAVIVAGGSGTRMESSLPKQFLPLAGIPVLFRTFKKFAAAGIFREIVLVLPASFFPLWKEITQEQDPEGLFPYRIAEGGRTRSQSVFNGLSALLHAVPSLPGDSVIAVHDGVRPFVTPRFLSSCIEETRMNASAIPCLAPPESFRYMEPEPNPQGASISLDRKRVRSIQTPQCFFFSELYPALMKAVEDGKEFTDEASLLESNGKKLHLSPGLEQNIKITRPFDMEIAEFLVEKGY